MKLLSALCLLLLFIDPGKIGKENSAKEQAKQAYLRGDYKTAINKYRYLTDSLGVDEEEVKLNLAHAYFQTGDSLNAPGLYQQLSASKNADIRSLANQQLGVAANRQGKFEDALNYFKQALKADPANNDARYNYEMVKKKLDEQKKQQEQQQKQDQQNDQNKDQKDKEKQEQKDQQNKDQQKKDQQKKEEQQKKDQQQKEQQEQQEKEEQQKKEVPPSVSKKLKDMNMSEEKAKMILEAMKNQEIQYLQQNKRKATKPKDKGKPDW